MPQTLIRLVLCAALFAIGLQPGGYSWAAEFPLPPAGEDLVGRILEIKLLYKDTLAALAQEFDAGYVELKDANPGVDPWLPGAGSQLILPFRFLLPRGARTGIVINIAEYRLYFYPKGGNRVFTFPVGLGREGFATPLLQTEIVARIENPSWTPTPTIRAEHLAQGETLPAVVGPGPDNPLGKLAIKLAAPGYFIHGTNKPFGVGQRISHGCVRLYGEDIERLVALTSRGTPVRIINQPVKLGWDKGSLYLESHRPLEGSIDRSDVVRRVLEEISKRDGTAPKVDWDKLQKALTQSRGVPVIVTLKP